VNKNLKKGKGEPVLKKDEGIMRQCPSEGEPPRRENEKNTNIIL